MTADTSPTCPDAPAEPDAPGAHIPERARRAAAHFVAKLEHETDPSDLAAARASATPPIIVDTRAQAAWDQGHIPGALHIPGPELAARAEHELPDRDAPVVVYCWGPGCNGSTCAALTLSRLGYTAVRELIGGFEYWAREGLAIRTAQGRTRHPVDELTAPVSPWIADEANIGPDGAAARRAAAQRTTS